MNANLFDVMERGYEAAVEMQHQRRLAAEEDYTEIGAELPTRQELVLLYANLKGQFRPGWYWSCERNGADTDYVCGQDFGYGSQGACHKANTARARAVRRLPV